MTKSGTAAMQQIPGGNASQPEKITLGQLSLYSVFHINVAFSSIPASHYPILLDRCYWPLLELAKSKKIPFGFEATGYSLEQLQKIDASFIEALKKSWHANEIEFIGSGYTQSIFPLCPARVNLENLRQGNRVYEALLEKLPETAYVNEQTYSSGLVDLYLDAGYKQLFMEWNNPSRYNQYATEAQYQPQQALNPDGSRQITVVWNDSIAFQKLQRMLSQDISESEYMNYLLAHLAQDKTRGLPFYGSDAEIIDYRPGVIDAEYVAAEEAGDLKRLAALCDEIQTHPEIHWVTPGQFAKDHIDTTPIRLESPEHPLPCKKQPKYNPTRWAVSGRDDVALNTNCFKRYSQMAAFEALSGKSLDDKLWRQLLEKWGSDFRTHTTDEKIELLRQTSASLETSLNSLLPEKNNDPKKVVIYNPNATDYSGPLVLEVQFPAQTLSGYPILKKHPALEAWQIEGVGHYQDGHVRWVKCALWVNLLAQKETCFEWEAGVAPAPDANAFRHTESSTQHVLETEAVRLSFLPKRGGAIQALTFKALDTKPWAGTIPHGYFDDIELGADFYSGHFILASKAGEKATDLVSGQIKLPDSGEHYPVRVPLQIGITTPMGSLWKTIYLYRNAPRIDLLYHFRFKDTAASSCRVGMMTVLPEAFDQNTLAYRTVNGGVHEERFALKDHKVLHGDPVSVAVSAHQGLGSTEGWVAVEDNKNRMILRTYPHQAYAMPMVHYQESGDNYFLRIQPSIGEFDDTSHTMRRGHHQVMFTWEGQKASDKICSNLPLVSLSESITILPV